MEDHWRSFNVAFRSGDYQKAIHHSTKAQRSTAHSNTLLRAVHQTNLDAAHWAQPNGSSPSSSAISSSTGVPFPDDSTPLSLRLFAHRTALVAAYNHALNMVQSLSQKSKETVSPIVHFLRKAIDLVLKAIQLLLPSKPFPIFEHMPTSEEDKVTIALTYSNISNLIEHAMSNTASLNVDQETISEAHDWARVASVIFDMISFLHICEKDFHTATMASVTARSLHTLAYVFFSLERTSDAAGETEKDDDANCDITGDSDAARSTYLQGLSLAMAGDEDAALSVIVRTAEAYLEKTGPSDDETEKRILYLASVLLARKRFRNQEGLRFSEACVSRLYRKVDALSLVARMAEPENELQRWRNVLDMDTRRPTALWLTSKAMGRMGKYKQQATILKVLEELLLETNDNNDKKRPTLENSIRLPCHRDDIDVHMVRAERGRALCAAGMWRKGGEILREIGAVETVEEMTALVSATPREVLQSRESVANVGIRPQWELVGLSLARAEAALRLGDINRAMESANDALRKSMGMETSECNAERLIRAVCVHNVGTLKVCNGASAAADEWFAAAQTAFEKCTEGDDVIAKDARSMATLSTMARCVTLWASGRREDAATHWVEKRGLQSLKDVQLPQNDKNGNSASVAANDTTSEAQGDAAKLDLVFKIDDVTLARMDAVCVKKCREIHTRDQHAQ